MAMVERDVGSAVAATVGEEVHSAVKGYRWAVSGMLLGIALLLFSGAVIGKTVMTSNRAARARADFLRVEAERNLMSRQVVQAQLKMMQAQVEPHFLFNTLANVRFLQDSDPAGAGTMLDHLIDYLHAALPQMRESSTTLAKETELARAYLEILRIRMGSRLDFAIDLPEALAAVSFPPMMLLSLVENAIKHGLEPMREGGRVDIEAAKVDGKLRLAVKDTGVGLSSEVAGEAGTGVGLANIRERLKTLYGDSGRLVLQENQPRGMIAAIEIPYVEIHHSTLG
jgi:LytS/YehU family sensor histidine kinase